MNNSSLGVPLTFHPKTNIMGMPDGNQPVPVNLSTTNCHSRVFDKPYHKEIMPHPNSDEYALLNKIGVDYQINQYDFVENQQGIPYAWKGTNPLLMDQVRGYPLLLDRPNFTGEVPVGNVPHDEIYTPYYSRYGKYYSNYNNITGGQIQYYVDSSIADPYFKPNFVTPAKVTYVAKVDPMGVYRFDYNRDSLQPYSWNMCKKDECDSFTHDTLEFRQELMEKQMRPRNEQRWSNRWASMWI